MDYQDVMLQFDQIEQKVGMLIERCEFLEGLNKEFPLKQKAWWPSLMKKMKEKTNFLSKRCYYRPKSMLYCQSLMPRINN